MGDDAQVRAALQAWRECLVDLSCTSRLLHFQPARAGSVEIADPPAAELVERLKNGESRPVEDSPALRQLVKRAKQDYLDRGVQVLHLAAGLLHWQDEENAEHVSPLVLIPVAVENGLITAVDEAVENPALALRLRELHRPMPGLSEAENVSVLSCFTFHKEALYRDLTDNEDEILTHPIIRALATTEPETTFDFTPISPADIDEKAPPETTPLVLDADATQRACIAAATDGHSFVMDGPPGTGKSQTITNMIACLLHAGKKVLFVSEKAAALDVVRNRLADAGLDPYLLELHSHQAGRKEVAAALAAACDRIPSAPEISRPDDRLRRRRQQLSAYAVAVNEIRRPLGERLHDVLGCTTDIPVPITDPSGLTAEQLQKAASAAERLQETWRVTSPGFAWRGVRTGKIHETLAGAQHALGLLTVAIKRNAALAAAFRADTTDKAASLAALIAHAARRPPGVRDEWLTAPSLQPVQEAAQEMARAQAAFERARDSLRTRTGVAWTDLPETDDLPAVDDTLTADAADNLARRCAEDADRWERHKAEFDRITAAIGIPPVETFADLDRIAQLAALGGKKNRPEQFWFTDGVLAGVQTGTVALRRCLEALVAVEMRARPFFAESILGQPLEQLAARFAQHRKRLSKWGSAYRRDRKAITAFVLPAADPKEAVARLGAAVAWQRARRDLTAAEQAYAMVLGHFWHGVATDFRALDEATRTAAEALRLSPPSIRPAIARYVCTADPDPELQRLAAKAREELKATRPPADGIAESISRLRAQVEPLREAARTIRAFGAALGRDLDLAEVDRLAALRRQVVEARDALTDDTARLMPLLGRADSLDDALAWADAVRKLNGGALSGEQAAALAAARPDDALPRAAKSWEEARARLREAFGAERNADWDDYDRAGRALRDLRADPTGPEDWFAHLAARAELEQLGLFVDQDLDPAAIPGVLRKAWADTVIRSDDRLRPLHAAERDQLVAEFRRLDSRRVATAPAEIIERLDAGLTAVPAESASLIRREAMKTTGHVGVRELLARTRATVLALKPCFLVSPLSVSQYLPPDLRFDVVIIDEASQVTPADAIAAIYRADALIVAGDDKQLPPTSFFDHALAVDDEPAGTDVTDFPSILELAKACGSFRGLPLTWHYRSRHESLIGYSNREFYRGRLITFPSATGTDGIEVFGVNGTYRRSNGRDNPVEAEKVAERVAHHFATRPDQSLGVVTFSVAQAEAIERAVDVAGLGDLHGGDRLRGFFVKSLESVQGDERDVMIFSIGYGFDDAGKISANFGPINKPNGRRRLNVAITRARSRIEIVTSIRARDIPDSDNEGVRMLAGYLDYAERGAPVPHPVRPAAERPFEESVREALESWGFPVRLGVGVDLAVPHPGGGYAIGIQCDGAGYVAHPAARDRDRLRDQVLRGLGWHLHRVWSTAWHTERTAEQERLRRAVEQAVALPVPGRDPVPPVRDAVYRPG
ncbi:AAA domain-containing protein [Actinoplanes sp. NPDC051343]|uniref:AAA domain-containing protein n=1 Tax=Actinoplanes sp. NPDC051343 TaxID=3363906 RepID=UPI00379F2F2A